MIVPIAAGHADELARVFAREREFLRPFEPQRLPETYTAAGQRERIARTLERRANDNEHRWVVVEDDAIVGEIGVSNIVRGALQSGNVGYWVARAYNGRGIASGALTDVCRWAFDAGELHRLEAGTLRDNIRSQRVLARAGFAPFGIAPRYLRIAGRWRDHVMFARTAEDSGDAIGDVEQRVEALERACGLEWL